MKKYINLNMVLILGLVTPEMQVHGGKKVAIIGGAAVPLVPTVAVGGYYGYMKYEFRALRKKYEQALRDEGSRLNNQYDDRNITLAEYNRNVEMINEKYIDELRELNKKYGTNEQYYASGKNGGARIGRRNPTGEDFFDNKEDAIRHNKYVHDQAKEIAERQRIGKAQAEYTPTETYYDPSNPPAPYQVKYHDDGSYTKTFTTDKRTETYDKQGFLRLETSDDNEFDKSYDKNGLLESGRKGNIHRQYFRDTDENLTGYEDTFHGKGYEMYIGNGVIDRDGTVTHTYMDGRPPSKPSIGLTEEDISGEQRRDPNYGQRKTTVVASQKQTDQKINGAAAKNESASGNSQNQNEVVAGNNPDRGSNNQPDGDQSKSGGDEGGDNSRQGGGDLLLE